MIKGKPRAMRGSKNVLTGVAIAFLILIGLAIVYMFLNKREYFQDAAKKVVVNYYFLEKCPYCVAFNPEWEKFEKDVDASIETHKIDGSSGKVPPYVKGFPYVEVGGKEYTGERTATALKEFVKNVQKSSM